MPTLSVIIATHNRADLLARALGGILEQTRPVDEILIVDDASTDSTGDLVRELSSRNPCITVLRNETNMGPAESRCRALERCESDFVVFHDDDDVWTDREFLENALTHMSAGITCVSANAHVITRKGCVVRHNIGRTGRIDGSQFVLGLRTQYHKPVSTFTTVFRRSALVDSGVLESRIVDDFALFLRALTMGDIHVMPEDVGAYVRHEDVISEHMDFSLVVSLIEECFHAAHRMRWNPEIRRQWIERQFAGVYTFAMASAPSFTQCAQLVRMLIAEIGVPSPRTSMRILVAPVRAALGRLRRRVMTRLR